MRRFPAQLHEHVEAALAWHLLIQQDQVVALPARDLDCVVAVCRCIDLITALPQKQQMRLEAVYLVIHPKNPLIQNSSRCIAITNSVAKPLPVAETAPVALPEPDQYSESVPVAPDANRAPAPPPATDTATDSGIDTEAVFRISYPRRL